MENKTGTYFKYAIGEIILVVIGILIALQINNWNNEDKQKSQTQDYLVQIKIELINEIELYQSDFTYYNENIKYLESASSGNYKDIDLNILYQVVSSNLMTRSFGHSFSNLEATGMLNTLPKDLSNSLSNYYHVIYPSYRNAVEYNRTVVMNSIEGPLIRSSHLLQDRKVSLEQAILLLNDGEFTSFVNYQGSAVKDFVERFRNIDQEASYVLLLIEKELEKKKS